MGNTPLDSGRNFPLGGDELGRQGLLVPSGRIHLTLRLHTGSGPGSLSSSPNPYGRLLEFGLLLERKT